MKTQLSTLRTMRASTLAPVLFGLLTTAALACGRTDEGYCFPDGNCDPNANAGGKFVGGNGGSANAAGTVNLAGNAGTSGNGGNAGFLLGGNAGQAGSGGGTCDTTKPTSCGSCDNDCTKKVQNVPVGAITCDKGACSYNKGTATCADNFYDVDGDPSNGCEFGPCKKTAETDNTCDGIDNNCNAIADEGVDLCAVESCGSCKTDCSKAFPNAKGVCTKTDASPTCSAANTKCEFKGQCEPGFYDGNGDPADGCEVKCSPTGLDGAPLADGAPIVEFCGDNIDNDCDGKIDFNDEDTQTAGPQADSRLFVECTGGDKGECAAQKGETKCQDKGIVCVGSPKPGELPETCNGKDDDCNGVPDDALVDSGQACGMFSFGICRKGQGACENGSFSCLGEVTPLVEVCNNLDDDCDDIIDGTAPDGLMPDQYQSCVVDSECPSGQVCRLRDSDNSKRVCAKITTSEGQACDVPGMVDPSVPSTCKAGATFCINAALLCQGSVLPGPIDTCGVDANCDGKLEFQPDFQNDPLNCGSCGNDCNANAANHVNQVCVGGTCMVDPNATTKCQLGFIDCDGNANDCERACTFLSNQEICNGVDDNCDCQIDESTTTKPGATGVVVPPANQACGVSAASTDPACGSGPGGVTVKCDAGKFVCTFPAGHCDQGNPPSCAQTPDLCDGLDNDCNGTIDDSFKAPIKTGDALGQPCASDDGKPQSDGECRAKGTYVCSSDKMSTVCSVKGKTLKCGPGTEAQGFNGKSCDEICDGKDNDCDGVVDEPRFKGKAKPFDSTPRTAADGAGTGTFMKPEVVKIGPSLWIHKYEVTRPTATSTTPGSGNGYWEASNEVPLGTPLQKTAACNEPVSGDNGRVPWFNVTPIEVEQTCNNMGGRICRLSEWRSACQVNGVGVNPPKQDCTWGYGANCKSSSPTTCNIDKLDFDANSGNGDQDGLLQVASSRVASCYADWGGQLTSGTGANNGSSRLFDITGNLREITIVDNTVGAAKDSRQYALMGGAFNSDENGSTCDFSFYTVAADFQLFSVGFRCCFDEYPDGP